MESNATAPPVSSKRSEVEWLENILKYGGWYYAFFVLLGFVELQAYYSAFGIEIWTYLGVGEILLSFLSTVGTLLYVTATFLGQFFLHKDSGAGVSTLINHKHHSKVYNVTKWILAVGVPATFLMQASYLFKGSNSVVPYDVMKWFVYLMGGALIGRTLGLYEGGSQLRDYGSWALVTISFFVIWLCAGKRHSGEELKLSGSRTEIVLITCSDTLATSDRLVYVGRCNAVTFLYDREVKYTRVVDNGQVIQSMVHPVVNQK